MSHPLPAEDQLLGAPISTDILSTMRVEALSSGHYQLNINFWGHTLALQWKPVASWQRLCILV